MCLYAQQRAVIVNALLRSAARGRFSFTHLQLLSNIENWTLRARIRERVVHNTKVCERGRGIKKMTHLRSPILGEIAPGL